MGVDKCHGDNHGDSHGDKRRKCLTANTSQVDGCCVTVIISVTVIITVIVTVISVLMCKCHGDKCVDVRVDQLVVVDSRGQG